jgi:hypothetical protein
MPSFELFRSGCRVGLIAALGIATMITLVDRASAESVSAAVIDAKSNLFGAGRSSVPDPGGQGGGILPLGFGLSAGANRVLRIDSVTGAVSYNNAVGDPNRGQFNGPDGGYVDYPPANTDGFNTDINSYGGISGLQLIEAASANRRVMFLAGVFLNDTEPSGTAPARLDFSSTALGTNFASLSPSLNQAFFIGDGLTGSGSGSTQLFFIPDAATRLFLGFIDGADFQGDPTFYSNNDGSFTVSFTTVPEIDPTNFGNALVLVIGALGYWERRRAR